MNAPLRPLPGPLAMRDVIEIASAIYDMSPVAIIGPLRDYRVTRIRHIAMYACRQLLPRSLPEIGRVFGNRDHTSVMHAVRKTEAVMAEDAAFADEVERFLSACRSAKPLALPDIDPFELAVRIMQRPGLAVDVSVETIRTFAAIVSAAFAEAQRQNAWSEQEALRVAFSEILPAMQRFNAAFGVLDRASDRGSTRAMDAFHAAARELITAFQSHFRLETGASK